MGIIVGICQKFIVKVSFGILGLGFWVHHCITPPNGPDNMRPQSHSLPIQCSLWLFHESTCQGFPPTLPSILLVQYYPL
eukprot:c23550_g1_i2 orf=199-435(+)